MADRINEAPATTERHTKASGKSFCGVRGALHAPLRVAGLYLLLSPFLALLHETMVHIIVVLLQGTADAQVLTGALGWGGFDPVYASVFERALGNIESQGLAMASPVGDLLHQVAPGLFVPSDRVRPGAWVSVLVGDQSSLLASSIATIGSELVLIFIGVALVGLAVWRRPQPTHARALAVLGYLFQISGVLGLLRVHLSFDDLESMGLSHVFTKLIPLESGTYERLVVWPLERVGTALVPAVTLLVTYGFVLLVVLLVARVAGRRATYRGVLRAGGYGLRPNLPMQGAAQTWIHASLVAILVLLVAVLSQRLFPAQTYYDHSIAAEASLDPWQTNATPVFVPTRATRSPGPSKVEISGSNYSYAYTVQGRRQRLRGVGYNVMYEQLSPEGRAARFDRDFAQMRAVGVNTILGWDPRQFDELMLTKAEEYGLGVVLPYHLPPEGRYTNPQYLEKVEQDALQWVRRFQGYSAVRMWGIGNEVIHGMGKNPNTPLSRAFAEFYVRLADKVHTLDPDHPVVYRDAEDVYIPPLRNALQNDRRPRPWLVYGVNIFTSRICQVLQDWPKRGLDAPLLVSEFAPSGFSRQDRPAGYQRMWRCVADNPETVLGGFAYVWSTAGPEAIDRVLGLVSPENTPVDGSLVALSDIFRREAEAER